jgi:hypothetical protein
VEFRILGPLEISADSERLELGGARQQIVVAMLLLRPNRSVTQAIRYAEQAAGLARRIGAALEEARALTLLGDAQAARGDAQT